MNLYKLRTYVKNNSFDKFYDDFNFKLIDDLNNTQIQMILYLLSNTSHILDKIKSYKDLFGEEIIIGKNKSIKMRKKNNNRNAINVYLNHNLCKAIKQKNHKNVLYVKTNTNLELVTNLANTLFELHNDKFTDKCYISYIKIITFLKSPLEAFEIYKTINKEQAKISERHCINIMMSQIINNNSIDDFLNLLLLTNNNKNIFITEDTINCVLNRIIYEIKFNEIRPTELITYILKYISANFILLSNNTADKLDIIFKKNNIFDEKTILKSEKYNYQEPYYNKKELLSNFNVVSNIQYKEKDLNEFKKWLDQKSTIDIFIDVANFAYYKSANFSYKNLNKLYEYLMKKQKSFVFIVHEKWYNKEYFEKWKDNIYVVPKFNYDDIFWLYGAIYKNSMIITNDQLRDHHSFCKSVQYMKWRINNQITFKVKNKKFILEYPSRIPVQIVNNYDYFLAPIISDDNKWLYIEK
jgi:hypothetical protein